MTEQDLKINISLIQAGLAAMLNGIAAILTQNYGAMGGPDPSQTVDAITSLAATLNDNATSLLDLPPEQRPSAQLAASLKRQDSIKQ